MTVELIKRMLDACYEAKRIREILPPLPEGVTPSYIHFLDVLETLEKQGMQARVSDIGDALHLPRPGVTRTVKAMEEAGYLRKQASEEDGRVTYLTITEAGRQLSELYNQRYFRALVPYLGDISAEDAEGMIRTVHTFYEVLCERREFLDRGIF